MLHHLVVTPEPKFCPSLKEGSLRHRILYPGTGYSTLFTGPEQRARASGYKPQSGQWCWWKQLQLPCIARVERVAVVTEEQGAARTQQRSQPWETRFKAWCPCASHSRCPGALRLAHVFPVNRLPGSGRLNKAYALHPGRT